MMPRNTDQHILWKAALEIDHQVEPDPLTIQPEDPLASLETMPGESPSLLLAGSAVHHHFTEHLVIVPIQHANSRQSYLDEVSLRLLEVKKATAETSNQPSEP
jgi:hypothetical protein